MAEDQEPMYSDPGADVIQLPTLGKTTGTKQPNDVIQVPTGKALTTEQPKEYIYSDPDPDTIPLPPPAPVLKPNVSPHATDEEIIKSFGYEPETVYKSPIYQAAKKHHGSGFAFLMSNPAQRPSFEGAIERSPLGAGAQGMLDLVMGGVQLGQHARGALDWGAEDTPYIDLLTRVQQEDYKQNVLMGQEPTAVQRGSRFAGNVAAGMALPGGNLLKGKALVPALIGGTLTGAETGALQPVTEGAPGDYWAQKLVQTGVGGATGVGGTALVRGGTNLAGFLMSKYKLPEQLANQLRTTIEQRMQGTWGDISTIQQAAAAGSKRAQLALNLIGKAKTPEAIEQAAIALEDARTAAQSSAKFAQVDQLAQGLGDVPLHSSLPAIDNVIQGLDLQKAEDKPLSNYLEGIRSRLLPKQAPPTGPPPTNIKAYMQWKAQQPPPQPANNTYPLIRELVSDMGDRIRMEKQNNLIGPRSVARLQQIKDALQQDLDSYTQNSGNPQLRQAAADANDYYRNVRVPFKDRAVSRAGTTDEPDTILGMFVKGGNRGGLAQKFYDSLNPKGRAAVQFQMIDKAIEDATDQVSGKLDPAKFLTATQNFQKAYGVFFRGGDQQAFQGLQNMMRQAGKAERMGHAPLGYIGLAAEALGAGAGALGYPKAGMVTGGMGLTAQMLKGLLRTNAGRKLLYSAAGVPAESPEMAKIFARMRAMTPIAPRISATGLTSPSGRPVKVTQPFTLSQQPWSPPFAKGGAVQERIRRNTFRSLGYEPL